MTKKKLAFLSAHFFELLRYGLVGLSSATTYWGGSNFLNWLHAPVWLSASLGWLASVLVSYFGHILFTYRVEMQHARRSWKFLVLCGINLCVTVGLSYLLNIWLNYQITSGIITIIIPLISYPVGKFWVFKEEIK